jgi:hypothetical protein
MLVPKFFASRQESDFHSIESHDHIGTAAPTTPNKFTFKRESKFLAVWHRLNKEHDDEEGR